MASYFTALSAVMAHLMSQPDGYAGDADRCGWWLDHSELWVDVADAADAGPVESRRARQLAGLAIGEACGIARAAVP